MGVAFSPAERSRRRGVVDVQGTLWLDRHTGELRRVEFHYVGLPTTMEAVGARGLIDFQRLPTDVWIVSAWELRIPRTETLYLVERGRQVQREGTANAVTIVGGDVAVVRREGEELWRSWTQPADRFPEVSARMGAQPACADSIGANPQDRGMVYGTITDSSGRPVRATVHASWTFGQSRSRTLATMETRTASADDGFFVLCGLPLGQAMRIGGTFAGERLTAQATVRLRPERPWLSLPLDVLPDAKVVEPSIWSLIP